VFGLSIAFRPEGYRRLSLPSERHAAFGSPALRILIADDHDLMRRGLATLLRSHEGWEICAEARTGFEAVSKAEKLKPDIAILDIAMPGLNGVDAARKIRKVSPRTEILVLSVHYSEQLIRGIPRGRSAWVHCEV
jgi:DNA-binding NarL/FixJ family response regulator